MPDASRINRVAEHHRAVVIRRIVSTLSGKGVLWPLFSGSRSQRPLHVRDWRSHVTDDAINALRSKCDDFLGVCRVPHSDGSVFAARNNDRAFRRRRRSVDVVRAALELSRWITVTGGMEKD